MRTARPLAPRHEAKLDAIVREMRRHFPTATREDALRVVLDEVEVADLVAPARRPLAS